jgi:hypothetical protein
VRLNLNRLKLLRTDLEIDLKDENIKAKKIWKTLPKTMQNDKRITKDISALKGTMIDLESQFKQIKEAQSNLEQRRKDRNIFTRSGNAVQTFASNFNEFLDAYSAVHGIAKAADAQYGGLATETLSLLFIVYILTAATSALC